MHTALGIVANKILPTVLWIAFAFVKTTDGRIAFLLRFRLLHRFANDFNLRILKLLIVAAFLYMQFWKQKQTCGTKTIALNSSLTEKLTKHSSCAKLNLCWQTLKMLLILHYLGLWLPPITRTSFGVSIGIY